jgi:hypothetical protein
MPNVFKSIIKTRCQMYVKSIDKYRVRIEKKTKQNKIKNKKKSMKKIEDQDKI